MKRATKAWLIIAIFLVIGGAAVFAGGMTMLNWDFKKLSMVKYETNTLTVSEGFENLTVDVRIDDLDFQPSEDGACKIVCHEQEHMRHTAAVTGQTLSITVNDERTWFEQLSLFNFDAPRVTVYLPKKNYNKLSVNTATGGVVIPNDFTFTAIAVEGATGNVNCKASAKESVSIKTHIGCIDVQGVSTGEMNLTSNTGCITVQSAACTGDLSVNVSTGVVQLRDVTCKGLASNGSTGNLKLENVTAEQAAVLDRSTGNVTFDGCDAAELHVHTSTGNVTGSLLSEKVFVTETTTGVVDVPRTTTGGNCEISTTTGNIKIEIKN